MSKHKMYPVGRWVGATTAAFVLAATAVVADPAHADPASPGAEPPPGTVTDVAPYDAGWVPVEASESLKVTYVTQSGTATVASSTGLVFLPRGQAPSGGWPVVSWAHGTQGIADDCAPSVSGPYDAERDGAYLGHWLDEGYAVVASDYAGLGTDGPHAYLHGPSAAHNIVDMVRAAHNVLDVPDAAPTLSDQWVSVGHSQGAGAAIYTARYASELGGDALDYRGTVGTGTPVRVEADMTALGPDVSTIPLDGHVTAYVTYTLAGIRTVTPAFDEVLSDAGREYLRLGQEQCLAELAETLADVPLSDFFTRPVAERPDLVAAITAYLSVPERGYDEEVFLAHGEDDHDVEFTRTRDFAADLISAGEPITFRAYPGTNHAQTINAAIEDTTAFVAERLGREHNEGASR